MRPLPPLRSTAIPPGDQPPEVAFPLILEDLENYQICRARYSGLVKAVKSRDAIQGR